jgi:hypothetical protein
MMILLLLFPSLISQPLRLPPLSPPTDLEASMRNNKKTMRTMTRDSLFRLELLLFPFWRLDAKGGEESIYLYRLSFIFGFGL